MLARRRLEDYLALTKPRVVLMVLITTFVGYYLGAVGDFATLPLLHTLVGTALAAGGTMTLNQFMERGRDAHMMRTRHRPLPDGRLAPRDALVFGLVLLATGLLYLFRLVSPLAGALTATIAVTYLLVYTPLKPVTSLCSLVGAIPGALPPVVGWAAARGDVGFEAWLLFAIMFLWQVPHTLAIGTLYRDDYRRAGIRVLPVVDWSGTSTGTHSVTNCLALVPVALMPTLVGMAGTIYFGAALVLSTALLTVALALRRSGTPADARRLLMASLVYLPVLLAVMALDKHQI
ncbi:MAG: heme o synthase, partial [Candidatus Binatia bacterium]